MIQPLLINTYDPKGGAGAARAAYRLHQGLIQVGVDSKMLVQDQRIDDRTVMSAPNKVAQRMWKARPVLDALTTILQEQTKLSGTSLRAMAPRYNYVANCCSQSRCR